MIMIDKKEIDITDPALLLSHDILGGTVRDNILVIIKPDVRRQNIAAVRSALAAAIGYLDPAELNAEVSASLNGFPEDAKHEAARQYPDMLADNYTSSFRKGLVITSGDAFMMPLRHNLKMILAPEETLSPAHYLNSVTHIPLEKIPASLDQPESFRYMITCHEIAHSWGCDEPRADMTAAILTRRAYGSSAASTAMADIRAVDAIWTARAASQPSALQSSFKKSLKKYGWKCVEANDRVAAMPDEKIENMSLSDIFACQSEIFSDDIRPAFILGAMLAEVAGPGTKKKSDMQSLVTDAENLERHVRQVNKSTTLHDVAARYTLATRRLSMTPSTYART